MISRLFSSDISGVESIISKPKRLSINMSKSVRLDLDIWSIGVLIISVKISSILDKVFGVSRLLFMISSKLFFVAKLGRDSCLSLSVA